MKTFCRDCFEVQEGAICKLCGGIVITDYTVLSIPMGVIWSDNDFNCRGQIIPLDVVDLVKDIQQYGLQFPIAVQPIGSIEGAPEDAKYRIIAGHRRFSAFKVIGKEAIPAMIKIGLGEVQARLVNLGENLKRQNLNILQEAKAIKRLRSLGMNRRQVSEELGVSSSWVQVRFNLLDLPEEIQHEAAAGLLNQYQVKELFSLPNKEAQFEAVKKIKNARLRGEKGISVAKPPKEDPFKKKRRQKNVVQEMIEHMGTTIGYGLHTRTLAWANGEISSAELYMDIKRYGDAHNIDYTIPIAGFSKE